MGWELGFGRSVEACDFLGSPGRTGGRKNMIFLATMSWLTGAVLAQRFKVRIMIPATAMVLVTAAAIGVAQARTAWDSVLLAAAACASMQVGYMIGLVVRQLLETSFAQRPDAFRPNASARQQVR